MERRLDVLEQEVARLRRQLVDMFPRDLTRVQYQPTLDNSVETFAQAVTIGGGHDKVVAWGLGVLLEGTGGTIDASRVEDMRRYPVEMVDGVRSAVVFVSGPGPLPGVDGKDCSMIPEFGRAGVFGLLMAENMAFYNGQLPLATCETWISGYLTALRQSTRAVLSFYDAPWSSWLEAGVFLWMFGTGNRDVFLVQQCVFDAVQFDKDVGTARNVPGAPTGLLTCRQRQMEVYDILRTAFRLYEESVGAPRVCSTYWGPGVHGEMTLERLLHSAGGVSPGGGEIPFGKRKSVGADLFNMKTQISDVSRYLRCLYVLGMYGPVAHQTEENQMVFASVCGDVRAMLAGFVYAPRDPHWLQLEPLAYFLRRLLVDYGVEDVVVDWHRVK